MKNRMADVRDHLVAMLETLAEPDADAKVIERAKATALIADCYIAAVKVEVDARKLLHDSSVGLPPALEPPEAPASLRLVDGAKVSR